MAVITGGSRGLGRAIAEAFAASGATVALATRVGSAGDEVADDLRRAGGTAAAFVADVRNEASVRDATARIIAKYGQIDVLVNAAGISPIFKRAELIEPVEWDDVLATNLRGTFLFCRSVGREMLSRGRGSIVNLSSVGGSVGLPRLAAYCASKGGVEALTKTLALEWAEKGVRVNALAPAFVRTDMATGLIEHEHFGPQLRSETPMGRFAEPEDVVGAAIYLASNASRYVTGTTLVVDGGWLAR